MKRLETLVRKASPPAPSHRALWAKRGLDIIGSLALLVMLLPLMLLLAILIRLDSPGPALYLHKRVGKDGHPFTMAKFRTMVDGAHVLREKLQPLNEVEGPVFKLKDDPRVTRLGHWLRRLSLDELPQLFNVLVGHMSLVGPRPALPEEVARYESWHLRRLSVTPGLTGLWQIMGRAGLKDFNRWVEWDLIYIDNWSLLLDLVILFKTLPVVMRGHGAY